jgi:hypothetical protein
MPSPALGLAIQRLTTIPVALIPVFQDSPSLTLVGLLIFTAPILPGGLSQGPCHSTKVLSPLDRESVGPVQFFMVSMFAPTFWYGPGPTLDSTTTRRFDLW